MVQSESRIGRWISTTPKWAWAVAGIAALALVSVIFLLTANTSGGAADQDSRYSQHPEDIKVSSCTESGGYATAKLRAVNSSTDQSTYAVKISFQAPQGHEVYDTQTTIIPQLDSHATSDVQVVRSTKLMGAQLSGSPSVDCVVTAAARYGS